MAKTKSREKPVVPGPPNPPPKNRVHGKTAPSGESKSSPSTCSTTASKGFVYSTPSDRGTLSMKSPSDGNQNDKKRPREGSAEVAKLLELKDAVEEKAA